MAFSSSSLNSKNASYNSLKQALTDAQADIKTDDIAHGLNNVSDLSEAVQLFENAPEKKQLQFAEYLLSKAKSGVSADDQLKYGMQLIDFLNLNKDKRRLSDEWQNFTKQDAYQKLILDLSSRRSLKDESNPANIALLHRILEEGIRCKHQLAYVDKIRYLYLGKYGYPQDTHAAREQCYALAKMLKDDFSKAIREIKLGIYQYKDEVNFLDCLSALAAKKYFHFNVNPNTNEKEFNILLQSFGIDIVTDIVNNLKYDQLKFLLAKYHAEEAIKNADTGNLGKYRPHIDIAEKLFDEIQAERSPLATYVKKYRLDNVNYGDVLYVISCSPQLRRENKIPYLCKSASYHHTASLEAFILYLVELKNTNEAMSILDQAIRELNHDQALILTGKLIKENKKIPPDLHRKAKELHDAIESSQYIHPALNLDNMKNLQGHREISLNAQTLNVSAGSSAYMVVTKISENSKENESTEGRKPSNDPYKLYISMDPSNAANFQKCWMILMKILEEKNVHGVKLFNPIEAAELFDSHGQPKKKGAQAGKMAVIYFKAFDESKQRTNLFSRKKPSQEEFYRENFRIIEKLEQLCRDAQLTAGSHQATPEGGIRAKSSEFGENETATFVYVSAKEQDDKGNYINSEDRKPNTEADNPYTNKSILSWERETSVANRPTQLP